MVDAALVSFQTVLPLFFAQSSTAPTATAPTTAVEPAAQASGGPLSGATVSLWDYIQAGGIVSYLMIIISIVAVALMVRNIMVLRMRVLAPPETIAALDSLLRSGKLDEAAKLCATAQPESFLTRVLKPAFERTAASPFGMLDFRTALEESAQTEGDELHRLNDGLGIIAAIGPMLGLLGTVFGMIGAFRTIGALEGAARSSQLSVFMSMALVNTAQGLIIAVPCTVAFALFRRHIDRSLVSVGNLLERIARVVTPAAPQVRGPAAAAPRPTAAPPPAIPGLPGVGPSSRGVGV